MNLKAFFVENWMPKLASILIATAIWYLIHNHLESEKPSFPVPGTSSPPARTTPGPNLDDTLLSPLAPPPVPGGNEGGN